MRLLLASFLPALMLSAPAALCADFSAVLSGTQEVPSVASPASGSATLRLNNSGNRLMIAIQIDGLDLDGNQTPKDSQDDVILAHIHRGAAGVNGPVLFGFIGPNSDTDGDFVLDAAAGTITSEWDGSEGESTTLGAELDELFADGLYINIHTSGNTGGEIRGQILPVTRLTATITGDQEVPAVSSNAIGAATLVLDEAAASLTIAIQIEGLDLDGNQTPKDNQDDVILAHIHRGAFGANGPGTFGFIGPNSDANGDLVINAAAGTIDSRWDGSEGESTTLTAELNNLLSEGLYINIHTNGNTGGEIRGQIVASTEFTSLLDGAQEVPAVISGASGSATLSLNGTQTRLSIAIQVSGVDLDGNQTPKDNQDNVLAAHIHRGAAGVNGPVTFGFIGPNDDLNGDLVIDAAAGTITSAWDSNEGNLTTLPAEISNLLTDGLYINIHTPANTGGEIRGQIVPEPSSLFLGAAALAVLARLRRRRSGAWQVGIALGPRPRRTTRIRKRGKGERCGDSITRCLPPAPRADPGGETYSGRSRR